MAKTCLIASCLFIVAAGHAWGQQAEISGFIKDPSDAVIPAATIVLEDSATHLKQTTKSNNDGLYVFQGLQPRSYHLSVSAAGFETKDIDNLRLDVGAKTTLDIALTVVGAQQSVEVSGVGVNVNATDASVSTVIEHNFVANIPLNGRSFQSLLTAVPGVTTVPSQGAGESGEISVNGQRSEANYFTVDGVSVNFKTNSASNPGYGAGYSGSTAGETALGTTQSLVSIDALEEFRAVTSTYSAEYGRTPGGQFSFQTRSGANQWHGSAYDYFRNDALDAANWFNSYQVSPPLPKPAERQNDFGETLGGPVRIPHVYDGHNRTFFFFSYEGLRLQTPANVISSVPSTALRQAVPSELQPFLNVFPLPSAADDAAAGLGMVTYHGTHSNPSSLDSTSLRIDHAINDKFRLFGRYSNSPSSTSLYFMPDLDVTDVHIQTATLGLTSLLTPSSPNELRFNFTDAHSTEAFDLTNIGGATPLNFQGLPGLEQPDAYLLFYISLPDSLGTTIGVLPRDTTQRQINITDSQSFVVGRHNLKVGIDYRRLADLLHFPPVHERPYFFSLDSLLTDTPTSFVTFSQSVSQVVPRYTNFSAFTQDEWRVNSRLSLSLGLRWDVNPAPRDAKGNDPYTVTSTDVATTSAAPAGTALWKTTYGNFAPRIGIAYQVRQDPRFQTVLRAGAGLYYDLGNTQASQGYNGIGFSATANFSTVGAQFPLSAAQLASIGAPSVKAPYNNDIYGFDPHLKLPRTWQWNGAIEQGLGIHQTLTVNYVGSAASDLLVQKQYTPAALGNVNFGAAGLYLTTDELYLTTNAASSSYHALQTRFQRQFSRGLSALLSYTWSHSIDDASSNLTSVGLKRASSDFDVRHNVQVSLSYELPGQYKSHLLKETLSGWSLDTRVSARSALPVDIRSDFSLDPSTGTFLDFRPDVVPGMPLYVSSANAPGGRIVNFNAFQPRTDEQGNIVEGNAGRNLIRGFDAVQADVAVRREFALGEHVRLQLRAEAFNILNHPMFGQIENYLSSGPELFGFAQTTQNVELGGLNSLYQSGSPRSLQLALRLHF